MKKIMNFILLFGGSGSGKSFIKYKLKDQSSKVNKGGRNISFHLPLQVTTREQRENEINGLNYLFTNLDNYDDLCYHGLLAGKMKFNNNHYGTLTTTFVTGANTYNVFELNYDGYNDFCEFIKENEDDYEFHIIKALVLSDQNQEIIKSHNNRDIESVNNEMIKLLEIEYDTFINNFSHNRADFSIILSSLKL